MWQNKIQMWQNSVCDKTQNVTKTEYGKTKNVTKLKNSKFYKLEKCDKNFKKIDK